MKLKNRLLTFIFSVFFFPLLLFIVLFEINTYVNYKKQYLQQREENLKRLESIYENKIESINKNIDILAGETRNQTVLDTKITDEISFLKKTNPEYEHVFYIDYFSGARVIDESKSNELNKIFDSLKDEETEFFISNPYIDKVSNKSTVTFIKKIHQLNFPISKLATRNSPHENHFRTK